MTHTLAKEIVMEGKIELFDLGSVIAETQAITTTGVFDSGLAPNSRFGS
jgi:hypothetical protein